MARLSAPGRDFWRLSLSLSYGRGAIRRVTGRGVDNPLVICLVFEGVWLLSPPT